MVKKLTQQQQDEGYALTLRLTRQTGTMTVTSPVQQQADPKMSIEQARAEKVAYCAEYRSLARIDGRLTREERARRKIVLQHIDSANDFIERFNRGHRA